MTAEKLNLSVDDLMVIFASPKELVKYPLLPTQEAAKKANDVFHMDIPYNQVKNLVMKERDLLYSNLDPLANKPVFEHVGSTSIEGMPGTLSPDILLIEESFPPSRSTINAIIAAGYYFRCVAPHDSRDLWFRKTISDSPCNGEQITLHLLSADNKLGKLLVHARDICNTDRASFEEYKKEKLEAIGDGTMLDYKIKKSSGTFIARLREDNGMGTFVVANNIKSS